MGNVKSFVFVKFFSLHNLVYDVNRNVIQLIGKIFDVVFYYNHLYQYDINACLVQILEKPNPIH